MKRIFQLTLLISAVLLSSCTKRILDFNIVEPEDAKAPTSFQFINQSTGFDQYWWELNDGTILTDSIADYRALLSGKYEVTLKGSAKNKDKSITKEFIVKSPDKCLVQIETPHGNMLVELFEATPKHRDNFLKLAEEGFFDDLLFHRVIDGFMIQGGDPNSRDAAPGQPLGSGGPGYQIEAEINPDLYHVKGALAAARTGDAVNPQRKSSGSQFYIVHGQDVSPQDLENMKYRTGVEYSEEAVNAYAERGGVPFLDQQYTVFGQVIEGLNVIDTIAKVDTDRGDRPVEDVKMKITVIK